MTSYTKILMLPLLGFLAASCSTTSSLQTSEVDDVYFSSSDKVTSVSPTYSSEVEQPQQQQTSSTDGNEQYALSDESGDITDRVSDPGSYADDERMPDDYDYQYSYYNAPFGNPYYAYGSPYYSGFSPRYSSLAMMDPFYSPYSAFYDPFMMGSRFGMGYGMGWPAYYGGLSVSLGLGWGGFGRYGYPGFYGGGYGYGYPYYGGGLYDNYYAGALRSYRYAPRGDRSTSVARRRPDNNVNSVDNGRFNQRSRAGVASPGYRTTRSRAAGVDNTTAYPSGSSEVNTGRTRRNRTADVYTPGMPSQETRTRRSTVDNDNNVQRSQRRTTDYTPSYEPSRSTSFPSSSGGSRGGSSSGSNMGGGGGGGRRGRN